MMLVFWENQTNVLTISYVPPTHVWKYTDKIDENFDGHYKSPY